MTDLTEEERRIADVLARALAPSVDANEVGKMLAYWRRWRSPRKVFRLLERLPESGLVRTGQTRGYYQTMQRAFNEHLKGVRPEAFGLILAWAFRLTRYYQFLNESKNKQNQYKGKQRIKRR